MLCLFVRLPRCSFRLGSTEGGSFSSPEATADVTCGGQLVPVVSHPRLMVPVPEPSTCQRWGTGWVRAEGACSQVRTIPTQLCDLRQVSFLLCLRVLVCETG